jgi:hypothetical protein
VLNNLYMGRRTIGSLLLAALFSVALTGCAMFFPSRPNSAPIFLTERDGQILFRWCGEHTVPFESLELVYRVEVDGERQYFTAARGEGQFVLSAGEEFTSLAPPEGLQYGQASTIPVDSFPLLVFVYADAVEQGRSNDLASIHVDEASAFTDGGWVSPTGAVDQVPC